MGFQNDIEMLLKVRGCKYYIKFNALCLIGLFVPFQYFLTGIDNITRNRFKSRQTVADILQLSSAPFRL